MYAGDSDLGASLAVVSNVQHKNKYKSTYIHKKWKNKHNHERYSSGFSQDGYYTPTGGRNYKRAAMKVKRNRRRKHIKNVIKSETNSFLFYSEIDCKYKYGELDLFSGAIPMQLPLLSANFEPHSAIYGILDEQSARKKKQQKLENAKARRHRHAMRAKDLVCISSCERRYGFTHYLKIQAKVFCVLSKSKPDCKSGKSGNSGKSKALQIMRCQLRISSVAYAHFPKQMLFADAEIVSTRDAIYYVPCPWTWREWREWSDLEMDGDWDTDIRHVLEHFTNICNALIEQKLKHHFVVKESIDRELYSNYYSPSIVSEYWPDECVDALPGLHYPDIQWQIRAAHAQTQCKNAHSLTHIIQRVYQSHYSSAAADFLYAHVVQVILELVGYHQIFHVRLKGAMFCNCDMSDTETHRSRETASINTYRLLTPDYLHQEWNHHKRILRNHKFISIV